MQYSFKALALVAIAGLAIADLDPVSGIDTCAKACLDAGATSATVGCKSTTDYACLCKDEAQDALVKAEGACILTACGGAAGALTVQGQATAFCKKVKAGELNTSAAPEPTSSAAPEPTTSAEPEPTSEVPVSSTALTPYPTSSAEAPTPTAVGTAAPTGSVPTSSLPPFQGGAAQAAAGVGSIFAAGLALLAAF